MEKEEQKGEAGRGVLCYYYCYYLTLLMWIGRHKIYSHNTLYIRLARASNGNVEGSNPSSAGIFWGSVLVAVFVCICLCVCACVSFFKDP